MHVQICCPFCVANRLTYYLTKYCIYVEHVYICTNGNGLTTFNRQINIIMEPENRIAAISRGGMFDVATTEKMSRGGCRRGG